MAEATKPQVNYRELAAREHKVFTAMQSLGETPTDFTKMGVLESTFNQATDTIEIRLQDWIGFSLLEELEKEIAANPTATKLVVSINSTGGNAFAGISIANHLASLKGIEITTKIESIAASAAAQIFMAGKNRLMGSKGGVLMFHQSSSYIDIFEYGNADELEQVNASGIKDKTVDFLRVLDTDVVKIMTTNTKVKEDKAKAFMKAEKFLNGETALKLGLATGLYNPDEVTEEPEQETSTEEEETTTENYSDFAVNLWSVMDSMEGDLQCESNLL